MLTKGGVAQFAKLLTPVRLGISLSAGIFVGGFALLTAQSLFTAESAESAEPIWCSALSAFSAVKGSWTAAVAKSVAEGL